MQQLDSVRHPPLAGAATEVPPTSFGSAGADKREAGSKPALCPQL
jgi:hypothetical protein